VSEGTAFLEAIAANPGDDMTRLVYADWLEERGDSRARFLRLEVELARMRAGDAGYAEREAERRLLRELDPAWCEQVGKRWDLVLFGYAQGVRIPVIKAARELEPDLGLREAKEQNEVVGACAVVNRTRDQAEAARARLLEARYDYQGQEHWVAAEVVPSELTAGGYDLVVFPPSGERTEAHLRHVAQTTRLSEEEVRRLWDRPAVMGADLSRQEATERRKSLRYNPGTAHLRRRFGSISLPLLPWGTGSWTVVLQGYPAALADWVVGAVRDVTGWPQGQAQEAVARLPLTLCGQAHAGIALMAWGRFHGRADIRLEPGRP
jgi:uncharacterized protein (TIGR02996 family)